MTAFRAILAALLLAAFLCVASAHQAPSGWSYDQQEMTDAR